MRFVSIVVAAFVVGYFIMDMIRDLANPRTISVYPIECKGQAAGSECLGTLGMPLAPTSFAAFPDGQQVIQYRDGVVTRLDGCAVFDWQTWNCTNDTPEGSVTQVMDRGKFEAYFEPRGEAAEWQPGKVYVSAWRYYWHSFTWKPSG
jgi:hypothetical protein